MRQSVVSSICVLATAYWISAIEWIWTEFTTTLKKEMCVLKAELHNKQIAPKYKGIVYSYFNLVFFVYFFQISNTFWNIASVQDLPLLMTGLWALSPCTGWLVLSLPTPVVFCRQPVVSGAPGSLPQLCPLHSLCTVQ